MTNFRASQKCIDLIKYYEGFREDPYVCTGGKLTIGYGHTKTVKPGMKITKKRATELLIEDLKVAENAVKRHVKIPITQNQFDALVSFVFNLGEGNFRSSTLLLYLNAGKFSLVPEQIRRWTRSSGEVTEGLVRRRNSEAILFESGNLNVKV